MSEYRDKLRGLTLGQPIRFKSTIVEYNGVEFEIRQPSIKGRSDMRLKCTKTTDGEVDFDTFGFLVWCVIRNTYVPGTNETVYEDADFDSLAANPTGGFVDIFSEVAADLFNVTVGDKKNT